VATALEQTKCDRCQAQLAKDAAYCDRCGERTRKARRMVRLAIRVELLALVLVAALIIGFTLIYSAQR